MKINCRAKLSTQCMHGHECIGVYGENSMADDGTYDGKSVVCDACYIAGGQPTIRFPASRQEVIDHVNRELGIE